MNKGGGEKSFEFLVFSFELREGTQGVKGSKVKEFKGSRGEGF